MHGSSESKQRWHFGGRLSNHETTTKGRVKERSQRADDSTQKEQDDTSGTV
jgi:hypothetical protein